MKKNRKLVVYGVGETAEIVADYFKNDSDFEVVGFTVDSAYLVKEDLIGLPVVPFEEVERTFDTEHHYMFAAASFGKLNRTRTEMYHKAKAKGYAIATYVSSKAFVWHNVELGENVMIFENNVIQYSCKIGHNVILWSGNHIGHQTIVRDNVFISSHCVVSGFCVIGENCFLGVNSTFNDNIQITNDTLVSSGSLIVKNIPEPGGLYIGSPARRAPKSSWQVFNITEE